MGTIKKLTHVFILPIQVKCCRTSLLAKPNGCNLMKDNIRLTNSNAVILGFLPVRAELPKLLMILKCVVAVAWSRQRQKVNCWKWTLQDKSTSSFVYFLVVWVVMIAFFLFFFFFYHGGCSPGRMRQAVQLALEEGYLRVGLIFIGNQLNTDTIADSGYLFKLWFIEHLMHSTLSNSHNHPEMRQLKLTRQMSFFKVTKLVSEKFRIWGQVCLPLNSEPVATSVACIWQDPGTGPQCKQTCWPGGQLTGTQGRRWAL